MPYPAMVSLTLVADDQDEQARKERDQAIIAAQRAQR